MLTFLYQKILYIHEMWHTYWIKTLYFYDFNLKGFIVVLISTLTFTVHLQFYLCFPLQAVVNRHHRQGSRVSGTGPHHQQDPAGAEVSIASNQALDSAATLLIEELSNKDRLQSKGGTKQRPCISLIHLNICIYVSTNQTMIVSKAF